LTFRQKALGCPNGSGMKKRIVKPKKGCCKSNPRCKRCPVVTKRLIVRGLAKRRKDGLVVISPETTKKQLKAARAR
jgi:hypothetical protein